MSTPIASAPRPAPARRRLSPIQRQLVWALFPLAAGVISAVHVLTGGPHPSAAFTWSMAALVLTPGLVKMVRHQLRTDDGFWLSQSVSTAGTAITTVAGYAGLWAGALMVAGVFELYSNPAAAPGTLALSAVMTAVGPAAWIAWRKLGLD